MKSLKVKNLAIRAGSFFVCVIHINDAKELGLWPTDRVELRKGKKKIVVIVDVSSDESIVKEGQIVLYSETTEALNPKSNESIVIVPIPAPLSVRLIKKKLNGKKLTRNEMYTIVSDISQGKLTEIELTYFIAASYTYDLSHAEVVGLTKAMVETGDILKPKKHPVFDKHCIGGVPGNRTTPLIVSICASAGLTMPKTSSRAITSAAGTADTMEVLTDVTLSIEQVKKTVDKVGACIVWGGALNLAPADDNIIKIEHPLSIDTEGNLIASILAKKLSVSSNYVLIDIPVARDAKVPSRKKALRLARKFQDIAKHFNLKTKVIITDGSEPIGNGIGPALEARDILYVLTRHKNAPLDLEKKSVKMAGIILEMGGKAPKGRGTKVAQEILDSGNAYKKFLEIINAQGQDIARPEDVQLGKFKFDYYSEKSGRITDINNKKITNVARAAGSPVDKGAGVYVYKHEFQRVKKGELLFTIYAENKRKLLLAKSYLKFKPILIK